MRIFLRHLRTNLLLTEAGAWTGCADEARSFRHSAEAMDFAREEGLREVEIVLSFDAPSLEIPLSLPHRA